MITAPSPSNASRFQLARLRMRNDVLAGLQSRPKNLPSKYFYDDAGSGLFEQITALPEYYLTRTELAIMEDHAPEMASLIGPRCLLIEYGCGSCAKTRLLLDRLCAPTGYVPIDISAASLRDSARALRQQYPDVLVRPLCADFTRPRSLPIPNLDESRRVVFFPGSTLGNLTPTQAVRLIRQTARLVGPDGCLLLGIDLQKDRRTLEDAYNDRRGITAAFNRNILARINRELGADFAVNQFIHRAIYNSSEGRIEMHLISGRDQRVILGNAQIAFAVGESICTEYSYKYDIEQLHTLARSSGFRVRRMWTDRRRFFCVALLTARRG